jgi:hypothetical protein
MEVAVFGNHVKIAVYPFNQRADIQLVAVMLAVILAISAYPVPEEIGVIHDGNQSVTVFYIQLINAMAYQTNDCSLVCLRPVAVIQIALNFFRFKPFCLYEAGQTTVILNLQLVDSGVDQYEQFGDVNAFIAVVIGKIPFVKTAFISWFTGEGGY